LRLEDEYRGRILIEWRSYLLRPTPKPGRDPEKFRRYTESWRRPAEEPDAGPFQVWSTDASPPSHSIPPHRAAKAARRLSTGAFRALHERLMTAYFSENRDISDAEELRTLWAEVALPPEAFDVMNAKEIEAEVLRDFEEAQSLSATGVPGLRRADNDVVIVGAQPEEVYRRWFEKSLADGIVTP
jgi:predicted DsbA family dithiol-disulfide isomerase